MAYELVYVKHTSKSRVGKPQSCVGVLFGPWKRAANGKGIVWFLGVLSICCIIVEPTARFQKMQPFVFSWSIDPTLRKVCPPLI